MGPAQAVNLSASINLGKAEAESSKATEKAINPKGGYLGLRIDNEIVTYVFAGSPAEEAGLMVGDRILDINGQTTFGMNGPGLADKMIGKEGSEVDLVVERGSQRHRYALLRALPAVSEQDAIADEKEKFRECAKNLN